MPVNTGKQYIKVILPLRLGWEPWYVAVSCGMAAPQAPAGRQDSVAADQETPAATQAPAGSQDSVAADQEAPATPQAPDGSQNSAAPQAQKGPQDSPTWDQPVPAAPQAPENNRVEQVLKVGQRVAVRFAGRRYIAVVSSTGGTPDIDRKRILPIEASATGLEDITPAELEFWRFLADYYLCTIGEVYKTAYPSGRTQTETKRHRSNDSAPTTQRRQSLDDAQKVSLRSILGHWSNPDSCTRPGTNILYVSDNTRPVLEELCRRTTAEGSDVLFLSPDSPKESFVEMRALTEAVRSDRPTVIRGSKSCLFLPFHKLGLVIVDDEHSPKFKHSNSSPRYNTRDAAAVLARIHNARLVLASSVPSLESFENSANGKLTLVSECATGLEAIQAVPEIIDTEAEFRKNGMVGPFSRKLLEAFSQTLDGKGRVLILTPWTDTRDIEIEARSHFPKAKTKLSVEPLFKVKDNSKYNCVALLKGEFLLGRNDFRADEKTFRIIRELSRKTTGRLLIQTADSSHPVWNSLDVRTVHSQMLAERRQFDFPPYTRMLEIRIEDSNEARKAKMSVELLRRLGAFQFFPKKDAALAAEKARIASIVAAFENEKNYHGFIIIDVDPV